MIPSAMTMPQSQSKTLLLGLVVGVAGSALIAWIAWSAAARGQTLVERRIASIQDYTRVYTATVHNMSMAANDLDSTLLELRAESERLQNQLIQTNELSEEMRPLVIRFVNACRDLQTQAMTDSVEINAQIAIANALFGRNDAPVSIPLLEHPIGPKSLEAASGLDLDALISQVVEVQASIRSFTVQFDRDFQSRLKALTDSIRS